MSRNLRTALIFGGFVSLIGAAFYPIYFRPLMRLEDYKREQAINRAGIVQEDVQPPGKLKKKKIKTISHLYYCVVWLVCICLGMESRKMPFSLETRL
uniref:Small integral membrane protein 20 n=1 Tax=Papio anubis TaxID=9555 RepID=A0A2I3LCL0_PAPAN